MLRNYKDSFKIHFDVYLHYNLVYPDALVLELEMVRVNNGPDYLTT